MESTIDLILKGHFEGLKQNAEAKSGRLKSFDHLLEVMGEAITYLEQQNDDSHAELIAKLKSALADAQPSIYAAVEMKKKPMKKAGRKGASRKHKKAM